MNGLQKLFVITISILAVGALAVAGLFVAAFGFIFLPLLFLFKKNDLSFPKAPASTKYQNNGTIDAEFERIETTTKSDDPK